MVLWSIAFFLFFFSIQACWPRFASLLEALELGRQKRILEKVAADLREIEETLLAGLVPSESQWEKLSQLPHPWGRLITDSLKELRECGGSLIPTLKRLRNLAEQQVSALVGARSRSSQALAQAMFCSLLVPILGSALYMLLPALEQHSQIWLLTCFFSMLLTLIGSIWFLKMTLTARWGGLRAESRSWMLASLCAGERFLALVRAGYTPDLAWTRAFELVRQDSVDLPLAWGSSPWETPYTVLKESSFNNVMEKMIVGAGGSIKKAIQVSLMDGTPCLERVEAVLYGLRQDIQGQIQRELSLLATKALKPLFLCVAPSLFGLLAGGLWLTAKDVLGTDVWP